MGGMDGGGRVSEEEIFVISCKIFTYMQMETKKSVSILVDWYVIV